MDATALRTQFDALAQTAPLLLPACGSGDALQPADIPSLTTPIISAGKENARDWVRAPGPAATQARAEHQRCITKRHHPQRSGSSLSMIDMKGRQSGRRLERSRILALDARRWTA